MLSSNCQQSCGRCPTCPAPSTAAAPPSTAPAASPLAPAPAPASDQQPSAAPSDTGLAPLPKAAAAPAAAAPPPSPPQQEAPAPASPQDLVQPLLAELPGSLPAGASSGGAAAVPGGGGGGNCTTDVMDFARGAPDLTLFLALASLTGWQQQRLADPQLAATLLLPTDDAIWAFLAQQGLTSSTVYLYSEQLESLLAYHTLPQPLSYADLERAAASGAQLPTDLPGAFLTADQVNSTALIVVSGANSAFLQRANILLCRTVVHVVDAVLMPTRSLQQVLPYNQAVSGLQAAGTVQPVGSPPSAEPGQPACYPSIAAAVNANPQLSIFKTVLGLSGWDLSNPGLNITLLATNDAAQQAAISGYLDPSQRELQQLLGEAAKDTRLLHASIAYQIVPTGGLTTQDLEQYIGEELPTVFEGHYITVEPGAEDGSLSVAGEFLPTNQSANLVSEARICGGSVIHVIDGSLQARTPLVEQYEAGTPLRDFNVSAGYEQYSTTRAQAEVDATAEGHAPPQTAEFAATPAAAAPQTANAPTPPAPASPPAAAPAVAAPASPPPAANQPPASLPPTEPTEAAATASTTEAAGGSSAAAAATDGSAAQPAPALATANGGAAPASEGGGSGSDGGIAAALSSARGPLPRLQLPAGSSVAIQATSGTGIGTDTGTAPEESSGTGASPEAAAAATTPVPPPTGPTAAATDVAVAPPAAAGGGSGLAGTTAGTASGGAAPGGPAAGGITPGGASSNGSAPGGTATSGGGTASSGTAVSDGTAPNCVTLKDLVEGYPQYFSRISQLAGQFGWDVVPPANSVTYMALLLNAPALSALAAYHTVNQSIRTDSMADGKQLPTLAYDAQGRQLSLTVRRGSGAAANDIRFQGMGSTALLLVPDVPIYGGTVQVVDAVLLPVQRPYTDSRLRNRRMVPAMAIAAPAAIATAAAAAALTLAAFALRRRTHCPEVHGATTEWNSAVMAACPSLTAPYSLPALLSNPHLETILAAVLRRKPHLLYARELLHLPDGGCVALDSEQPLPEDAPLLLLLPGLTGGSEDGYVQHAVVRARQAGMRAVVFNSRGTSGTPVLTAQFYSASFTGDLRMVVAHLRARHPRSILLAAGWSAGANLLTRYLGEEGEQAPFAAAATLCNPFSLVLSRVRLRRGFSRFYSWNLARSLKRILTQHKHLFDAEAAAPGGKPYRTDLALQATSIGDYDEAITCVSFGWTDVLSYYAAGGSADSISNIRVPLLIAANDPISPLEAIPFEAIKANPACLLVLTPTGGHLGWCSGEGGVRGPPWTDGAVADYFAAAVQLAKQPEYAAAATAAAAALEHPVAAAAEPDGVFTMEQTLRGTPPRRFAARNPCNMNETLITKLCNAHLSPEPAAADIMSLPDDVLATVIALLPQRQKAQASLVCRRWAYVTRTAAALWETVELSLKLPDPGILERTECFLSWLIPRAAAVEKLGILATRESAASATAAGASTAFGPLHLQLVWSNLVSALTLMGPTLRHVTIEWPDDLQLSTWVATLVALESGSFTAPRITIRPGLGSLAALKDLRLRSSKKPLAFSPSHASPSALAGGAASPSRGGGGAAGGLPPLLPVQLLKLRMEGCHLTELPAPLTRLSCLEDLVLSDNNLQAARLMMLSRLTTLQQLTMMGCNMQCLPPALAHLKQLRVLYLDMGIQAPAPEVLPMHRQCDVLLGPLERLGILSMGACHLQAFPAELAANTSLRALYLDDNCLTSIPPGSYLEGLRVLGIDWRVLLNSHSVLRCAPSLTKLCLMSMGKLETEAAVSTEADVAAVVSTLTEHPSLQQVLLPSLDGHRSQLYIAALNVLIGISAAPHLTVKAVTYHGICNDYPLLGVVALASVLGIYSSVRHLWTNPEVYPTRAYRQEGVPESDKAAQRAKGYEHAIFRAVQEGRRRPDADRPHTGIF
ncbi:Embryogenesis-associated protein B8 [Chlorella vulgaris]